MKVLGNVFFTMALGWYFWHLVHRLNGIYEGGFIGAYLADLIVIPIVCTTVQWVLNQRKNPVQLSVIQIAAIVVVFSMYCEVWLPYTNASKYTQDIWDIACYAIGATVYTFWKRLEVKV